MAAKTEGGFDWAPVIKAMSYTGGIAGALGAGGPQAMTNFVNKIADKQNLAMSQEWESREKRDAHSRQLERDESQREHERDMHQRELDATIGRTRRASEANHMAALNMGGTPLRMTYIAGLGADPETPNEALGWMAAKNDLKPSMFMQQVEAGTLQSNFAESHGVGAQYRALPVGQRRLDFTIDLGERFESFGVHSDRIEGQVELIEKQHEEYMNPEKSQYLPGDRHNQAKVTMDEVQQMRVELGKLEEQYPDLFSKSPIVQGKVEVIRGNLERLGNVAFRDEGTWLTIVAGADLPTDIQEGNLPFNEIVDSDRTRQEIDAIIRSEGGQIAVNRSDNTFNAVNFIKEKLPLGEFTEFIESQGEDFAPVLEAVKFIQAQRELPEAKGGGIDFDTVDMIYALQGGVNTATAGKHDEIQRHLKALSNVDTTQLVQSYAAGQQKKKYVNDVQRFLTSLSTHATPGQMKGLFESISKSQDKWGRFATTIDGQALPASGINSVLKSYQGFDQAKLRTPQYIVDYEKLLGDQSIQDFFVNLATNPGSSLVSTEPDDLWSMARTRIDQLYKPGPGGSTYTAGQAGALETFQKELKDAAINKIYGTPTADPGRTVFEGGLKGLHEFTRVDERSSSLDPDARTRALERGAGINPIIESTASTDPLSLFIADTPREDWGVGEGDRFPATTKGNISGEELIELWSQFHSSSPWRNRAIFGLDSVTLGDALSRIERLLGETGTTGTEYTQPWQQLIRNFGQIQGSELTREDLTYPERTGLDLLRPFQEKAVGKGKVFGARRGATQEQINAHLKSRALRIGFHLISNFDVSTEEDPGDRAALNRIQDLVRGMTEEELQDTFIGGVPIPGEIHQITGTGIPMERLTGDVIPQVPSVSTTGPEVFDTTRADSPLASADTLDARLRALKSKYRSWSSVTQDMRGKPVDHDLRPNTPEITVSDSMISDMNDQWEDALGTLTADATAAREAGPFIEGMFRHIGHVILGRNHRTTPTPEIMAANLIGKAAELGQTLAMVTGIEQQSAIQSVAKAMENADTVSGATDILLDWMRGIGTTKEIIGMSSNALAFNRRFGKTLDRWQEDVGLLSTSRRWPHHNLEGADPKLLEVLKIPADEYASLDASTSSVVYNIAKLLAELDNRG